MKTLRMILGLAMLLVLASLAVAADPPAVEKTDATPTTPAEAWRVDCVKQMNEAYELLDKGSVVLTRGQMLLDNAMIADGKSQIARGEKLLDDAKKSSKQCKQLVEAEEKKRAAGGIGLKSNDAREKGHNEPRE
jgi:hypothetical protein